MIFDFTFISFFVSYNFFGSGSESSAMCNPFILNYADSMNTEMILKASITLHLVTYFILTALFQTKLIAAFKASGKNVKSSKSGDTRLLQQRKLVCKTVAISSINAVSLLSPCILMIMEMTQSMPLNNTKV